ncbi:polyadenylate-binding protein, cytoplasmic and nuclear-like [Ditylenchus destructor]|nr:polyadenylate-binding protein, cytoplasmic and nuclear-like [Ditylenchus destructor]
MIARSRLVGNFLSHCAMRRQLTRVIGLSQSVRFQSTSDNPDKNFTLKLPPNATGVSVEHSNEKSLDGTSLRVTLNISVLQTNKSAPESGEQLENLKKPGQKYPSPRELKVTKSYVGDRTILIDGLSAEILPLTIQDYFSRFGDVELARRIHDNVRSAYVTFKSPKAVNHVLNCVPHYIVGDRISIENPMEENQEDGSLQNKNRDTKTKDQSQLLEISRHENDEKIIIVHGLSMETSPQALRGHFLQFGKVVTCGIQLTMCAIPDYATGHVVFESPRTVNLVMDRGPHYFVGGRISNDNPMENQEDRTLQKSEPPKTRLFGARPVNVRTLKNKSPTWKET